MPARKKSSEYLCKYVEAQIGRPYWRGPFGQHASMALLAYERKRFPDSYKAADFEAQAKAGQKVHDCCGLVKAANVCETVNSDPEGMTKEYDLNPKMYYDRARVKGEIGTFPKVRGYLVYNSNKSHVGVYVGDDTVTEARGHAYGVVHSKITDKRWKYWSDDVNIEYDAPQPAPGKEDEVKYSELEVCRKGSKGDAVRTIQANVHVFVDGVYGNDTEKAVREFQSKNKDNSGKALTVDGVVGAKTWEAIINKWSAKK